MRYLRHINDGLLEDEFQKDIRDILLEIKDIGYEITFSEYERDVQRTINYILIYNHGLYDKSGIPIDFSEIKECLLRLKDYLGDRYDRFDVYLKKKNEWENNVELTEDYYPKDKITSVCMIYK